MERHFIEKLEQENRRSNIFITTLVVLVLFLAVVRVGIANVSVESSERLKNLDREIASLQQENQLRAEKIRAKESLASQAPKLEQQGFQKTAKYSFVKEKGPVALNLDAVHN